MIDDLEGDDVALEARASARLGATLLDKYRLDRVLGSGAMATVYAATHRNGNEVALKLLHPEVAHDPDLRSRFLREGYVANQVKHAGAVSVIDDDVTADGSAFLVMERLEGVTVQQLSEERGPRLHPAWVTAISLQLLDVMASAHAHGIIHRDLKPANLFVTRDGDLKVLDFGIARMRDLGAQATNAGCVLGTPAFMAPEQAMALSKEIDERTDLWAIGSVAFALLAGEVVHPAENTQQTLVHAATRPARSLGPIVPDVPAGLVRVFEQALVFDKAGRWSSATEMRDALTRAAEAAFGDVPGATVLAEALRSSRSPSTPPPLRVSAVASTASAPSAMASTPKPSDRLTEHPLVASLPAPTRAPTRGGLNVVAGLLAVALGIFVIRATAPAAPIASHDVSPAAPAPVRDRPESNLVGEESPAVEVAAVPPEVPFVPGAREVVGPPVHRTASVSLPARPAASASLMVSRAPTRCNPPFVIDRLTQRKIWKVDCL